MPLLVQFFPVLLIGVDLVCDANEELLLALWVRILSVDYPQPPKLSLKHSKMFTIFFYRIICCVVSSTVWSGIRVE